jgi:hypothetical protein
VQRLDPDLGDGIVERRQQGRGARRVHDVVEDLAAPCAYPRIPVAQTVAGGLGGIRAEGEQTLLRREVPVRVAELLDELRRTQRGEVRPGQHVLSLRAIGGASSRFAAMHPLQQ